MDCFLSAEGILFDEAYVSTSIAEFDDDLFCVHMARQYSAARELDDFLNIYNVDLNDLDEHTAKYMAALEVCV